MLDKAREYVDRLRDLLTFIETQQTEAISAAAQKLADVVERGGIIHTFGSGHSHCAAEDIISRTGGSGLGQGQESQDCQGQHADHPWIGIQASRSLYRHLREEEGNQQEDHHQERYP